MKKIFVSLITYNNDKETKDCLDSIAKSTHNDIEVHVVMVDNFPDNPTKIKEEYLKEIPLTIIRNKINSGFTGGHNTAIAYSLENGADYVVVLNNDTILATDMFEKLFIAAEKNPKVGAVLPKIYFAKGSEFHKDRYKESELGKVFWYAGGYMDWNNIIGSHRGMDEVDHGQYDKEEETDEATGCCVLMKRELLEKVNGFDKRYFLYYEDADLSQRIKKAGYSILYVPQAVLWHINAASTGGSGSKLQDYFITRNRMLFGMTYASLRTKFALLRESLRLLLTGREWQKAGVKDYYLKKYGKGSFK